MHIKNILPSQPKQITKKKNAFSSSMVCTQARLGTIAVKHETTHIRILTSPQQ